MLLQQAQKIAVDICYKLQPYTEKINIAGSIRRQKNEVNDIEIICIPHTAPSQNLFGTESSHTYRVFGFRNTLNHLGEIIKGNPAEGKYLQIQLPENIKLDLFMPAPRDYYRIHAIRTGSAEYANKVIAKAWLKKGWCGTTNAGLCKQSECVRQGDKWTCVVRNPTKHPGWKSEEDFFSWLGIKHVHAALRDFEARFISQ